MLPYVESKDTSEIHYLYTTPYCYRYPACEVDILESVKALYKLNPTIEMAFLIMKWEVYKMPMEMQMMASMLLAIRYVAYL